MSSAAPTAVSEKRGRVAWLDLFRGAAVLAMIETHVVNTFLAPGLREAAWFGWLNWGNGLVAPAFLFIAGYALGMGWRVNAMKPVALARKTKRLLGVAALGYALHFPFTELGQHRWAGALRTGTQVDVLPCLAVTLLGVLGVQGLAGMLTEKWRRGAGLAALFGLGSAVVWLAPASAAWSVGAVPLDAFLNDRTGSLFPLFPWAAFVFCGVLAGSYATPQMGWMLVAAGVVKGGALPADDGAFSALSPVFFCDRLAGVLALAALGHWVARGWKPGGVLLAGRESLVMYAAHLVVIEWAAWAGVPRGGLGLGGTALVFAAVLGLTLAVALGKARWTTRMT